MNYATKCVHGRCFVQENNSDKTPLYLNNTYNLKTEPFYSRYGNVNSIALEKHLLSLYNNKTPLCTVLTSGMAAYLLLIQSLKPFSSILVSNCIYAEVRDLLELNTALEVEYVDMTDISSITKVIKDNTSLILLDSPTNPLYEPFDIKAITEIAHKRNVKVCVDNTLLTSYYYNPFNDGADCVIESLGKYCCGHGDVMGGVLLGMDVKKSAALQGLILSPMASYMLERSLVTLPLRMKRITSTAYEVHKYLLTKTKYVRYYGQAGLITFVIKDTLTHEHFISRLRLIINAYSFGQEETMILSSYAPHSTNLPKPYNEHLRLAIGLEDAEDIIVDLEKAFNELKYFEVRT